MDGISTTVSDAGDSDMVHAHRPVDGISTTVSDVVHDGVSARHQVRRRCRTSYRMTSIIPSFVLVDSNNLAKDDDREVLQYSGCPDLRV